MWNRNQIEFLLVSALWLCVTAGGCARPIGTVLGSEEPDAGPLVCSPSGGAEPGAAWPFFRGFSRREGAGALGPQLAELAWFHEVESPGFLYSSPVVSGLGAIYLAQDGNAEQDSALVAIREDGTRLWRLELGSAYCWTSPAIAHDGTIVIGTGGATSEGMAMLVAVSSSGVERWRLDMASTINSSPVIDAEGVIYVATYTYEDDSSYRLQAISADGVIRWSLVLGALMDGSPALGSDCTIYAATAEELLAVSRQGQVLWRVSLGTPRLVGTPALGTPVVAHDGTVYVAAHSSSLFAVGPSGQVLWERSLDEMAHSTPALAPADTVSADSPALYTIIHWPEEPAVLEALSASGELLWERSLDDDCRSPPIVGADGAVYVTTLHGSIRAFDSEGATLWTLEVPGYVSGSGAMSSGRLYVGSASRDGAQPGLFAIGSEQ